MGSANNLGLIINVQTPGEAQLEQFTQKLNNLYSAAKKGTEESGASFDGFAAKIKSGIEDPLQSAGQMAESFLKSIGPIGAGIAATGTAMIAFAAAGFEAAKSLGDLGTQTQNLALRTGLTTKEVGQFSFAAKLAGQDIGVFESAMRILSKGLEESDDKGRKASRTLKDMGVQTRDSITGGLRPMSDIFLQISEKLNGMQSATERNVLAMNIFGRAGIELIPTMLKLREGVDRAKELDLGLNPEQIARFEKYHQQITEIEAAWDRLARRMKEPLAAAIMFILQDGSGHALSASDLEKMGISNRLPNAPQPSGAGADTMFKSAGFNSGSVLAFLHNYDSSQDNAARIARDRSAYARTLPGLEESLKGASADEASARSEYFGYRGTDSAKVQDLHDKWMDAQSAVTKYTAQVEAAKKAMADVAGPGWSDWLKTMQMLAGIQKFNDQQSGKAFEHNQFIDSIVEKVAPGVQYPDLTQRLQGMGLFAAPPVSGQRPEFTQEQKLQLIQQQEQHQLRLIQLEGTDEAEAIQKTFETRMNAIAAEKAAGLDEFDARMQALEALQQREEQLHQLRIQQEQQYVDLVKGGVRALLTGGRAGFDSFLKSILNDTLATIAGNAAQMFVHAGMFAIPGQGTANNPTPLGKLLQGTVFAGDPMRGASMQLGTSATQLSSAAQQLMAAARALAVSPGGGGGSFNPGGVFSGASSSNPFVFNDLNAGQAGSYGGMDQSTLDAINGTPTDLNVGQSGAYGGMNQSTLDAINSGGGSSSAANWAGMLGTGAAVAGGIFGVYSGLKKGGPRGTTQAISSGTATAALLDPEPISKAVLMGIALVSGIVGGLLGDPKQQRSNEINSLIQKRAYTAPTPTNYVFDAYGRTASTFDRGGSLELHVHVPVNAIDTRSAHEWIQNNGPKFADTVKTAMLNGQADAFVRAARASILGAR